METGKIASLSETESALNFYGLKCPHCQYNLTGLREPVCAECGRAFDPTLIRGSEYFSLGPISRLAIFGLLCFGLIGFTKCSTRGGCGAERTRSTLHMAKGLSTEYRAQFGYAINHDPLVVSPIDWTTPKAFNTRGAVGSGYPNDSIEKFVWAVWQIEELRDRLQTKAMEDVVVDTDGDGFLELIDSWGNKIEYAAYVRRGDGYKADDHLPASKTPIFISPGADGLLGTYLPATGTAAPGVSVNQPDGDALDNKRSDEL